MLSFGLVDSSGAPLELVTEAGVAAAPPLVTAMAMFDRLLDPGSLEDDKGMPKAGVALADVAGAPVNVTTNYVPNGDSVFHLLVPPGPSLTVSPICGWPSGASVQVALVLEKLRSHDLRTTAVPATGVAPSLSFTTEPLSVGTDIMMPEAPAGDDAGAADGGAAPAAVTVDPQLIVNVTFNDLTPGPFIPDGCPALPTTADHIHVTATLAGDPIVPFAAVVTQDMANAAHWTVAPPGSTAMTPGMWPAGALVTVTIDAAATDLFGKPLGSVTSASFMVKS